MSFYTEIIDSLNGSGFRNISIDKNLNDEEKYIVIKVASDSGGDFGDDASQADVISLQIHYFLPLQENYLADKKKIRKALLYAGCTYPEVTQFTESDTRIRHLIFSCEKVAGSEV